MFRDMLQDLYKIKLFLIISSVTEMLIGTHKELRRLIFYKIIHNNIKITLPDEIQTSARATRSNHLKFEQLSPKIDAYKFSFYPTY